MLSKRQVEEFFTDGKFALAGFSRSGKKFGNIVFNELKQKGFTVYPIHPVADSIDGVKCYSNFQYLPESVKSLIVVVKPGEAKQIIIKAAAAGIKYVWLQHGSSSQDVLSLCNQLGVTAIHGECILMVANPIKFPHNFHKALWKLFGRFKA
jgi:uncharacterized protein